MEATISQTQGSEPASFEAFVLFRSTQLYRSAWLLTGDHHHAEDLLQTVLGTAWRRWDRINADGTGEAWVRRALYTTYVSWRRRRWWNERSAGQDVEGHLHEEDFSAAAVTRLSVTAALDELPRAQRAVLLLRYYEDMSEAQIAEILGISPGTVKSHASRAVQRLRQRAGLDPRNELS